MSGIETAVGGQVHEGRPTVGVSIVIPAYNEEQGISSSLDEILQTMSSTGLDFEVIVVDDGSTDKTSDRARETPSVRVLRNHRNLGYGASLKRGIDAAQHPIVVITDADGTYPGEDIPQLVALLTDDVAMVVGWRKGFGAKIPLVRRPAKWVMRRFAESMAAFPIQDLNSGLRAFRKEVVQRHLLALPDGFSFTTTLTLLVLNENGQIIYEPIAYRRREGKSKFHPVKDVLGMISLIVRSTLLFNPLRVFVPIAFGFFALAAATILGSWIWLGQILDATATILVVAGIQSLFLGFLADLINRRSSR